MKNNDFLNKKQLNTDFASTKNHPSLLKWYFFIIGTILSLLLIFKLAISEISIDLSEFDFDKFLSLILALFAVSLSAVFYFKSTDSSNKFYDNTYKFTQETSIMLGRIETGFGERLENLNKIYDGLSLKFEKMKPIEIKDTQNTIDEIQKNLDEKIEERDNMINDLLRNSKLKDDEKDSIKQQLQKSNEIIDSQRQEIIDLNNKISMGTMISSSSVIDVLKRVLYDNFDVDYISSSTYNEIRSNIIIPVNNISNEDYNLLINKYIIKLDGGLTVQGAIKIKQVAKFLSLKKNT
jgi:hypothetical protein